MQAHLNSGQPALYSRNGLDFTARLPELAASLTDLPANTLIMDGEVISLDVNGHPDFTALRNNLSRKRSQNLRYVAFDLLYLDGFDLRQTSLEDRKRVLQRFLATPVPGIHVVTHENTNGQQLFAAACRLGLEGIVAKRRDSPYRSGNSTSWLKIKCPITKQRQKAGEQFR